MIRLEMKNYKEATGISASLSSDKVDKYDYPRYISKGEETGEETLPSNKGQIIERTKCAYSPLGKAFETNRETGSCIKVVRPF